MIDEGGEAFPSGMYIDELMTFLIMKLENEFVINEYYFYSVFQNVFNDVFYQ